MLRINSIYFQIYLKSARDMAIQTVLTINSWKSVGRNEDDQGKVDRVT